MDANYEKLKGELSVYQIRATEKFQENHSYAEEQALLDRIRHGDVEVVKNKSLISKLKYPEAAVEKSMNKNNEYMIVSAITLMARAAIEGGVATARAFEASDVLLNNLSKCITYQAMDELLIKAVITFTELVKEYQEQDSRNNYVEECKRAVAGHICEKISLGEIAKDLGLSPFYLARLFHRCEGVTIGEFIRKEKMKAAQNMLKYSGRTIFEISQYMQFSSPSYFSRVFKKEVGMTPQEYRDKNRQSDF